MSESEMISRFMNSFYEPRCRCPMYRSKSRPSGLATPDAMAVVLWYNPVAMLLNTEADILERIIQPDRADLPPEAAKVLLSWRFSDTDRMRMAELSEKAAQGTLDTSETRELDGYLLMGHLLAIAHSKARQSLQRHQPAA